jgi:membrane protein
MSGNSQKNMLDRMKALYQWANRHTGGALSIIHDAFRRFTDVRAAEAAAGIAFYAIFSLFPLLLALIAAGSFVLESEQVQQWVLDLVAEVFPVAQQLIKRNIRGVLELRGTVGIIALIGLVWSATGVLTALARNINLAWPEAEPRSFVEDRVVALGMVTILAVLLVISSLSNTVFNVLARFRVPIGGGLFVDETPLWTTLLNSVPRVLIFLAFLGLYHLVPNTKVSWSEAFWGALVAAPAGEIATNAFSWYLSSGIVEYELVYGSLGTVVALMLWIYINALITLFGAHLSAAVARHGRSKRDTRRKTRAID